VKLVAKPFLGRVGEGGVHAHSLVVGGLAPEQESAGAAVASARGREVPWIQAPVQTIHVQNHRHLNGRVRATLSVQTVQN